VDPRVPAQAYAPSWPPPGFAPPAQRPRKQGLSTTAIVVIVVLVVVVVTVVPALVLFYLVSGLTTTTVSTPNELGMSVTGSSSLPGPPATYYVNLTLSPTVGLFTSIFGLEVFNGSSGTAAAVDAPSGGCSHGVPSVAAACTSNGSGWYAVLTGENGSVLATYGGSGGVGTWANFGPGGSVVLLNGGDGLVVVSGTSYVAKGFDIRAFGTGTAVVTGGTTL